MKNLLLPILSIRKRYIPLLMIYFAYGCSAFTGIGEAFYVKEHLGLTATALIALGVWLTVPWTIKMVFGQIIDNFKILGSNRKVYIYIAACLMAISSLLMVSLAGEWDIVKGIDKNTLYIVSSLVGVIGIVLQDVTADAMSIDVVDREGQSEEDIKKELTTVQLLARLALTTGVFATSGLAGWIAQVVSYETLFTLALIIPVISILGTLFIKINSTKSEGFNKGIIIGGIIYSIAVVSLGVSGVTGSQEIVFIVSFTLLGYMVKQYFKTMSKEAVRDIISLMILVFIFRAMPGAGVGVQWFMMDTLGFDKAFFGTLGQIGAGMSILGMFVFAKHLVNKSIVFIFFWVSVITYILSLPMLGMYYGLHEWTYEVFGFGQRTIAIVDTAAVSPFDGLMMIPVLAIIARYAPKGNSATWFALMASFMNLALNAGSLLTKYLNMIFVVDRGDYSNLGYILIITSVVGIVIPITSLFIYKKFK
jgi:hypothetical protein